MKKLILFACTLAMTTLSVQAQESFRVSNRAGHTVLLSEGENPVVLAEFDNEVSLDNLPDEVRSFLRTYTGVDATDAEAFVQFSDGEDEGVEPLLGGIKYDQGEPYNDLCPILNGARSITGCVATAMAQVMRYWKYPQAGQGTATYSSSKGATEYKFADHPFDWDNMLETYTISRTGTTNYNATQASAVATLMLACGASVNMNYDYAGSGSYISNAYVAMRDHFNYSSDIRYYESDTPNWEDWTETLQDQFRKGQPVLYGGVSTSGGHAFVLDGYLIESLESGNTRTRFHVNWGWNGNFNGYFLLRKLQPDTDNYSNLNQRMVINIRPANMQAIENVDSEQTKAAKVLRDGQLIIERNQQQYTALGQRIR